MMGTQDGLVDPVSKKKKKRKEKKVCVWGEGGGEKEMSSFIPLTTQNAYSNIGCIKEGATVWKALVSLSSLLRPVGQKEHSFYLPSMCVGGLLLIGDLKAITKKLNTSTVTHAYNSSCSGVEKAGESGVNCGVLRPVWAT